MIFNNTEITHEVIGHRNSQAWQTHRICIVGSRKMTDRHHMHRVLSSHTFPLAKDCTFLCGRANGADRLGELWATKYMPASPRRLYPANWADLPRVAGFCRNVHMASEANEVIAFVHDDPEDGSRGTRHMIRTCQAFNAHDLSQYPIRIHVYGLSGRPLNPNN